MIHYLTVQDILWINHEVSNCVNTFKHAQLEEATFYQYGYGESQNVIEQAGHFLQGFIRLRPFEAGNRATAFIAVIAFLEINGFEISLSPGLALDWVMGVAEKKRSGLEAVKEIATPSKAMRELKPMIRTHVKVLIAKYQQPVSALVDSQTRA